VAAKSTANAKFQIENTGDMVTGFNLQTNITGTDAADFRVRKSSSCVTNGNSVRKNTTCTYKMAETPQSPPESAQMTITATPKKGGQAQVLTLELVGGSSP
jgi:hypothetical protein